MNEEHTLKNFEEKRLSVLAGVGGIGVGIITTMAVFALTHKDTRKKLLTAVRKSKELFSKSMEGIKKVINETTEEISLQNYISRMEHTSMVD